MPRNCPPNTESYTIKPGDNFYRLARRFNTTVPAIVSANPEAKPENLNPGQQICIPKQKNYSACPEGNYYTIKQGDTLYAIARKFNISLADLKEANPYVNPEQLSVGNVICIPLATPPARCPDRSKSYTIQRGDTFYSISRRFNTTVNRLKQLNPGINPNALLIGQKICVPG